MSTPNSNVIVVGGSLGGLCAGIVLKYSGRNVTILERTPSKLLHNQGAGIVAGGETQKFFSTYDRTRTPIAVSSSLRQYLDKEGNQIHREDLQQKMTSWDLLWNILRANFTGEGNEYCSAPAPSNEDGGATYENGMTVLSVDEKSSSEIEVKIRDSQGNESTRTANMLIACDGPSSTIRGLFEPDIKRTYAGYVAFRGTVPESELPQNAKETFPDKFTFFHADGIQTLCYMIPGERGIKERGSRLANWVWYSNYEAESQELVELMTDAEGKRHAVTLPVGKMQEKVWNKQMAYANEVLPPQFADMVKETKHPFVQAITDVISSRSTYLDGKVFLLGDAVAGFRPHTAASTSQAAYDSMLLAQWLSGEISRKEWEDETMKYAREIQRQGVMMGNRSQFGAPFQSELMRKNAPSDIGRAGQPK